ncbi:arsenic resistance protein [Naumannella halotolerans]|uniref:ACR3 family arsenite efflux pump ArsB n=1 Tax=Naumannella halotolerans TaxID=993414 RepID=A0A4R7J3D1_9ACTN|nr:bile acid:sodium symporter [Naumannella halotolerans]TDT30853.1 ACR3 family arsenite efflux pump ArsB [Naumannella halotolerans]
MSRFAALAERHQVMLYLVAIGAGILGGWFLPGARIAEVAIEPALGLLLFATFLSVPFDRLGAAWTDLRFLGSLSVLNFVLVPLIVFGLSRFVAADRALLVGMLLVLLAPCVDYVIVFSRLVGGSADKLLAVTPLLMIGQLVLLPVCFVLFLGPSAVAMIDPQPFLRAFCLLILLPLAAAAVVQRLRLGLARQLEELMQAAMVPLLMITLATVVGSQIRGVGERLGQLWQVVCVYAAFVVIMNLIGLATARMARLPAADGRALIFSGVTRNSLVVLPLALALPQSLSMAPLVVVTQTLVELVAMVIMVRLLPRVLPERRPRVSSD